MKATLYSAGGGSFETPPIKGGKFSIAELERLVHGRVQIVGLPEYPGKYALVLNDDGRLLGLPENAQAMAIWAKGWPKDKYPYNNDGIIVGDALLVPQEMMPL